MYTVDMVAEQLERMDMTDVDENAVHTALESYINYGCVWDEEADIILPQIKLALGYGVDEEFDMHICDFMEQLVLEMSLLFVC